MFDASKPWQTTTNTHRITGLSRAYLLRGCKEGIITHRMVGNRFLIYVPDLLPKDGKETEKGAGSKC